MPQSRMNIIKDSRTKLTTAIQALTQVHFWNIIRFKKKAVTCEVGIAELELL